MAIVCLLWASRLDLLDSSSRFPCPPPSGRPTKGRHHQEMGGWSREGPGCLSPAASLCPSVATAPAGPILPRSCSHGLGERGPAPNLVPYSFGGSGGGGDRFLLLPAAGLPAGSVPHSVLTHLGLLQACITLAPTPPPPRGRRDRRRARRPPMELCCCQRALLQPCVPSCSPEWTLCHFLRLKRERRASGDYGLFSNTV